MGYSPSGGSYRRYIRERNQTGEDPAEQSTESASDLASSSSSYSPGSSTSSTSSTSSSDPVSDPNSSINTRQSTPNYRPDMMSETADVSQSEEQAEQGSFSWTPTGAKQEDSIELSVDSAAGKRNPDAVPKGADPSELVWSIEEALSGGSPVEQVQAWFDGVLARIEELSDSDLASSPTVLLGAVVVAIAAVAMGALR